nr:unnamed protein product [Spirometra erinaceieuropaei]
MKRLCGFYYADFRLPNAKLCLRAVKAPASSRQYQCFPHVMKSNVASKNFRSTAADDVESCKTDELPLQSVADVSPPPQVNFKQTAFIRESHGKSIFGLAFNSANRSRPTDPLLFATAGGNHVTIYQCKDLDTNGADGSSCITLLQSFSDPAGEEEDFYTCAWSRDTNAVSPGNGLPRCWWLECSETQQERPKPHQHQPVTDSIVFGPDHFLQPYQQLLAVAGKRGIIRILCPSLANCPASLVGHGQAINELKFHPKDPALLFSFSKDYTIRLWNIATHVPVCIFGGAEGHRSEVLYGDLSLTGDLLLSAGMDHTVKIWRLDSPELKNAIINSFTPTAKPFPTLLQHFPEFSSRDAHGNYVDCARWFGSLIISKSCENSVVIWKPGSLDTPPGGGGGSDRVNGLILPTRLKSVGHTKRNGGITSMTGVPTEHHCSILHQLKIPDCNLWYIRFDLDLENRLLALGTGTGPLRIYIWDLSHPESAFTLTPKALNVCVTGVREVGGASNFGAIRQTRFANDGNVLVAVGDNGLIVRFDKE